MGRSRARSQDDPAPGRSAGGAVAAAGRAGLHRSKQSHGGAYRQTALRVHALAGISRGTSDRLGDADLVCDLRRHRRKPLTRSVLLIFDLDGTLVDSRRDLADSANGMLAVYGAPPIPQEA